MSAWTKILKPTDTGWTKIAKPSDTSGSTQTFHPAGMFMGILGLTYAGVTHVAPATTGWTKILKPTVDNFIKVGKPTS